MFKWNFDAQDMLVQALLRDLTFLVFVHNLARAPPSVEVGLLVTRGEKMEHKQQMFI